MLETGFAQEVIDALPARLTPDLSGIQITVSGLGVGTHLNADQIGVLREIWTLYAAKTNASVRFD
jgi:hypothetical protein